MAAFSSFQQHHSFLIDSSIPQFDQISTKVISSAPASIITDHHKYDKRRQPSSAQSKGKKIKKQKKMKKNDVDKKKEAPTGYIHVRARRGQATDSHSLAERVRREKISERMKLLQAIVPGCDKVTGKALMLDEIINYVQSLQNQVEFLSMKLASVNPMYYEFGMDLESFAVSPDQACSPTAANNHLLLDNSANSLLLQQEAGCRQTLWEVDELIRLNDINQSGIQQQPVFFH